MPLRAHLVELRNRVLVAGVAVLVGSVVGWFLYEPVFDAIISPLRAVAADPDRVVQVNFGNVATSFDLKVQVSVWLGVLLSSPVWIFQLWAFITPGLTRKERWYATGFLLAAVPLFLSGVALAWLVLPNAVQFLTSFTPDNPDDLSSNIIEARDYISFVTRLLLAFGIAFLIPVVMVALNFTGLATGRSLLTGWRVAIVAIFVFAAIASPTPDLTPMFALAGPMILLYFVAVGIALLNDRRRARRDGTLGVDDDEASAIDEAPSSIDDVPAAVDPPPAPVETTPPAGTARPAVDEVVSPAGRP